MSVQPASGAAQSALTRAWLGRGPLALALLPLSWLFGLLVGLRHRLYRLGWLATESLPVPVLVVGNRVAGGAGKTPATIAVVQHLQARGLRIGVVSRGHGRTGPAVAIVGADSRAEQVGDEPLLIARRTRAPVAVARRRAAAARELLNRHPDLDVIVTDDGLQHLALARDIEIVVFDERGAGNGWLLPAGPLREPIDTPSSARRQLVLYSGGQPSTHLAGYCGRRRLAGFVLLADWRRGLAPAVRPERLFAASAEALMAAAGIAVPQRFFDQLTALGLRFQPLPLPDHYDYAGHTWPANARLAIVTEKDAVKLQDGLPLSGQQAAGPEIWVAQLDFEPEPAFFAALDLAVDSLPPPRS